MHNRRTLRRFRPTVDLLPTRITPSDLTLCTTNLVGTTVPTTTQTTTTQVTGGPVSTTQTNSSITLTYLVTSVS
jgi:hypothetical protein